MKRRKIVICGSGNAAHIVAGLSASDPDYDVWVFTRNEKKAKHWQALLQNKPLQITKKSKHEYITVSSTNRLRITSDARAAGENCDMIILVVPAFAHELYLKAMYPYINEGVVVVGFPGQNGFEFEVKRLLKNKPVVIMNYESCPWSCRITEFGSEACILGAKAVLVGAVMGDLNKSRVPEPFQAIRHLFGKWTEMVESQSILGITLMSINAYSHPPIMYYAWKDWDGKPIEYPPLFYYSITKEGADLLTEISDEGQTIKYALEQNFPSEDFSYFLSMMDWDITRYGHMICDKTDQHSVLTTNQAYANMTHPMIESPEGLLPDFNQRFLTEDVPFGLVPVKGIAELAGVATPKIDEVLMWCQDKMNKEYIRNGKLQGKDLESTRAPQRYGYNCLKEIL